MHVNSDIDDRMDPEMSTDAAAKYLKSLNRMFGNWEMALAAYNCGPGNVRKAIRRSGGKKTFWGIYNYLPRETRSYVPQFQAFLYILNHLEEHNFNLEEPSYPIEFEKIRFERAFRLDKLAELTDLCVKDLEHLNPSIKAGKIPETNRTMAVRIPKSKSMYLKENLAWISDSLGNAPKILLASDVMAVEKAVASARTEQTTYRVKSGDVLGKIAAQHGVTITQLKSWNNLSSNLIRVGQTLVIHGSSSSSNLAENSSGQKKPTPSDREIRFGSFPKNTL